MAAKKGQKSQKLTDIPYCYEQNFMWELELDGRTSIARELRDRLHALASDLGGWENLSYAGKSTCRRAIHLERHAEQDEKRFVLGQKVDCNLYLNFVNTLSGQWGKLGMKKRKKPAITLNEYINGKPQPVVVEVEKQAAPSQPPPVHIIVEEEPESDDDH